MSKGRVSDVHDDVELPYPDAKVAEKLCFGGACIYKNCDEDDAFKNSVINSFFKILFIFPSRYFSLSVSANI